MSLVSHSTICVFKLLHMCPHASCYTLLVDAARLGDSAYIGSWTPKGEPKGSPLILP